MPGSVTPELMSPYDLLVFDLDGTICDPIEGITRCINYALEWADHPPVTAGQVAKLIGPPLDVAFGSILRTASNDTIDGLIDRYRERYADIGFTECRVYPGVEEALRGLSANGTAMAVCTSKRSDLARRVLEHHDLSGLFRFVDGGEVRQSKASQLERLFRGGKITRASVMIGDRDVDVQAGIACGLVTGGVLWGFGSPGELEKAGADFLFRQPSEWMTLVDRCARAPGPGVTAST